jgi:hypothetical protein
MAAWAKTTLAGFCLLGVGLGLVVWVGSARWRRTTLQLVEKLVATAPRQGTGAVNFENFEQLPAPVARYFRRTLRDGQPLIRVARFSQAGELRIDEKSDRWTPFEANQVVAARLPGFVWDARIHIVPLMHVRVRDAYVAGQGSGQVTLLSAVTLAEEEGQAELNSGALHRYLAEAVWYPTALLPSAGVRWSPIDDNKALATLTDSGITVSLEFRFNDAGEVMGIYTSGRWGRFGGEYALTPWEGYFRHYEEREDMWVPTEGEVGWYLPGGWLSVWKGRIVDVTYDLAR